MNVKPYDGLTRFMVESENGDAEYLVDLTMNWGVGQCSCHHFQMRLGPQLKEKPYDFDKFRCKHIRACRESISKELLDTLIRKENVEEKTAAKQLRVTFGAKSTNA